MKRIVFASVVVLHALVFSAGWLIGAFNTPAPPAPAPRNAAVPAADPAASRRLELRGSETLPGQPARTPALPAPSIDALLHSAAQRHGIPPTLVRAIAKVESDFDPRDVSPKGARGVMQVMPATGLRFGVSADHLFDPALNIAAGTAYLAWLLARYDGDLDLTLAAYNAGEGAVDRYRGIPPYRETQTYVRRVKSELAQLEE